MFRIVLVLILGLAGVANAGPGDDTTARIEALAQKAAARYEAKAYVEAVELYLEAYRLGEAAALLYNVAVIYDKQIKDPELAIQYYRRYISAPDADPAAASRATKRIQTLKAEQAKRDAARRKAELAKAKARMTPPAAPATSVTTRAAPPPESNTAAWVITGVGVVALGVGAGFGVSAAADGDEFEQSTVLDEKKALRDDGQQKALVADVLMGVGAAAVITGVVMLLTADDAPALGVAPTSDGRGGAVWLGGSL